MLVNVGAHVTVDQLIDEVWPFDPPASAQLTVQTYIRQIRLVLARCVPELGDPKQVLTTRSRGYALDVPAQAVDVTLFFAEVRRARDAVRAGDLGRAAAAIEGALARCRDGEPLGDVPLGPRLAGQVVRIESERLLALELFIDLQLAAGKHSDVVALLTKLVVDHPGHERFSGQLMLALYRCGRRAEALETYRHTRCALRRNLDLDPGLELDRLHSQIRSNDEILNDHRSTRISVS